MWANKKSKVRLVIFTRRSAQTSSHTLAYVCRFSVCWSLSRQLTQGDLGPRRLSLSWQGSSKGHIVFFFVKYVKSEFWPAEQFVQSRLFVFLCNLFWGRGISTKEDKITLSLLQHEVPIRFSLISADGLDQNMGCSLLKEQLGQLWCLFCYGRHVLYQWLIPFVPSESQARTKTFH